MFYLVWGRYDEALSTYQLLLKYYNITNSPEMRGGLLNNIAVIYNKKGEYDQL